MFIAILFVAIGLAILLNTLGIMNVTFWGFFWGLFFLAVGFKMMMKRGNCPICGWGMFQGRMHDKIHEKMSGRCCNCSCENDSAENK
ncbi:MAG: hypothetical protein NT155_02380 [Candidatus Staskawiczbacteria bacterium]|nr:hypothetical protein [Candidatus Staskawiczbacteria bacterium]